jgi:hypothetical protein
VGAPARELNLSIFTTNPAWIVPSSFRDASVRVPHLRLVSEFAQLPDFGYSLADWASQFLTCPVQPGADVVSCHNLEHHMGAINSNHFPPQSQNFYRHYHELALAKAADCAFMRDAVGARTQEFFGFLLECDSEALILEAVGQHYLQDAWSSGHMWERWGSPELSELPGKTKGSSSGVLSGLVVGAVAGAIHGSEVMLHVPDAMCSEDDDVQFYSGGSAHQGIGDLYLDEFLSDGDFAAQRDGLLGCAASSVSQVYAASSHVADPSYTNYVGAPGNCFEQRATNAAMLAGFGNIKAVSGLVAIVLMKTAVPEASSAEVALAEAGLNLDLALVADQLKRYTLDNPQGTEAASGGLLPLLDMKHNGAYPAATAQTPASYVDARLQWPVKADGPSSAAETPPRLFNRAHAQQWCTELREANLEELRNAARAGGPGSVKHALCVEYAQRHARRRAPDPQDPAACLDKSLVPMRPSNLSHRSASS